jgi:hypothetical protein
LFQLAKKRKISRGKGKQAMLTEEMVYEMNRYNKLPMNRNFLVPFAKKFLYERSPEVIVSKIQ